MIAVIPDLWWPFYPVWLAFAAWLVWPAVRDRHNFWLPERVQMAVRRCLSGAPLVLGLALLASGQPFAAAVAPGITLAVMGIARSLPPE